MQSGKGATIIEKWGAFFVAPKIYGRSTDEWTKGETQ